jgi:rare lipoprotein A
MIAAVQPLPVVTTMPAAIAARNPVRIGVRRARLNVLDGRPVTVTGRLLPRLPGRAVALKALGRHGWRTVARTTTGAQGRFRLSYVPPRMASRRLEVRFGGDLTHLAARRVVGRVSVYRLAGASWYGGGGSLACGGYLTSATMGVANKTLPCGTMVTLRYGGRTVRVPVVDRGPFVAGREFDLTEATKRALGFEGVGVVWSSR